MNQLLSSCDEFFIVGLRDRAYAVCSLSSSITELKKQTQPPKETEPNPESEKEKERKADDNKQKTEEEMKEIHSVSITTQNDSTVWCAVTRGDKTISIYKLSKKDNASTSEPILVYDMPKRVGCMAFTNLSSQPVEGSSSDKTTLPMLVAGDMGGDAYAYSLQDKRRRLLVGHTASMLTGLCVWNNQLLTADRDEKIRVSAFPDTYVIEGFLLGHEAYITSIDTAGEDAKEGLVASCGADSTLRLWSLKTLKEAAVISFTNQKEADADEEGDSSVDIIPADVAINSKGSRVAVVFDQSNRLDIYSSESNSEGERKLTLVQSIDCPSQPLGVVFQTNDLGLVVLRDSEYLMAFKCQDVAVIFEKTEAVEAVRQKATEEKIVMPATILEKDKYGNPKLQKLEETRGPAAADAPWNRVERIDKYKQRTKRHKKRKLEQKELEEQEQKQAN